MKVTDLTRAYHFAALKHVNQRRKGEAAEPYMNHLTEVGDLVAAATAGKDIELIVAAILHDTLEDTETSPAELEAAFGVGVRLLVEEVTDDKSLPKAERKRLQIEHASNASAGAKIIKLADKTSNLRTLASSPPSGWSAERKAEYASWAGQVVAGCRGVNERLEAVFDDAIAAIG